MKINLFFFIPSLEFGGAGNAIINLINSINKKKFNVTLFYQGKNKYKNYISSNIKQYKLYSNRTYINFITIKKFLKKKLDYNRKNIFISNIHFANLLAIIYLRSINNLKIVIFERTSLRELDLKTNDYFIKNRLIKYLISKLYGYTDLVLTNSKNTSKDLKKISVYSEVVYSCLINKILKKRKIKKKKYLKFISVGRLEKQKDYRTLLKAVKSIKSKNFKLFIYGEGSQKQELKRLITKLKIDNIVELKGHEENKDKIYLDANLLILTSVYEGLPNCIIEALNYNVPVIASDIGGNKEILANSKYGNTFRNQNHNHLAYNVEKFIKNPNILEKKSALSKKHLNKFLKRNTTLTFEKKLFKLF